MFISKGVFFNNKNNKLMKIKTKWRRTCLTVALTGATAAGFAQKGMEVLPANEKWFVGAGAGVHFYVGESDGKALFGDKVSPGGELSVGKWITPALAVRLQLNGEHVTGAYEKGDREPWNFMHVHVDAMLDVISWWKGVDEERKYRAIPLAGIGVASALHRGRTVPTFTLGLLNSFRIHESLDLNVEAKGAIVGDKLNGISQGGGEGSASLTAGFTYYF